MEYLIIIFLELFLLLLFSMVIPSLLVQIFYFFTKSQKIAIYLLSIIVLPGTLIHELAHMFTAAGVLVSVSNISLLPEIKEHGVKLGHVEIAKTDFFRRALIGFAPVFFGMGILVGGIALANNYFFSKGDYPIWLISILFYLMVVIGNTMFSSRKDMEGTLGFVVLVLSIFGALYFLGLNQIFIFIKERLIDGHPEFLKNFAYFWQYRF